MSLFIDIVILSFGIRVMRLVMRIVGIEKFLMKMVFRLMIFVCMILYRMVMRKVLVIGMSLENCD